MTLQTFLRDVYLDISLVLLVLIYIAFTWQGTLSETIGVLITLTALPFWIWARKDLGTSFSVLPEAHQLVTHGLYTKIQNPMYCFGILAILGLIIAMNHTLLYLLLIPILTLQFLRAKKERVVLMNRFGQEYLDYQKKTWF